MTYPRKNGKQLQNYVEATKRAAQGERIAFWCYDHRCEIFRFREYLNWLTDNFPYMQHGPTKWWTARMSTSTVDFAGGGQVRFVSSGLHTDGVMNWYGD